MFCDVERYKDNNIEEMAKYGMGAIYEKTNKGDILIKLNDCYIKDVITNYYDKHHELLDRKVEEILKKYNKCYIIDLHSFSDEFVEQILKLKNNPDICLGYEEGFVI